MPRGIGMPRIKKNFGTEIANVGQNIKRKINRMKSIKKAGKRVQSFGFKFGG
jgi:hypothetical protein